MVRVRPTTVRASDVLNYGQAHAPQIKQQEFPEKLACHNPHGSWQTIEDAPATGAWYEQGVYGADCVDQYPVTDLNSGSTPFLTFYRYERALRATISRMPMAPGSISAARDCIRELAGAMSHLGPQWRVKPFGGIQNGFAMQGSDLDVTCYQEGREVLYTPLATEELQTRLLPLLRKLPRFEVVNEIWTARVPIIKLRFDRHLDVDLSCHNTEALNNTRLLRAYADLSPVVRELGLLVKLWAKGEGVCGAPQGFLSSYSLTLMALYYLQVDPEVRMPCLPTERYKSGRPADRQRETWACPLSAQVLFARFFRFYAHEFAWGVEVVSVRRGRRASAGDKNYDELRATMSHRLHIEDPFLRDRNLNCVLGQQQEAELYARICDAVAAIRSGSLPVGLRRNARKAHTQRITAVAGHGGACSGAPPPSAGTAVQKAEVVGEACPWPRGAR